MFQETVILMTISAFHRGYDSGACLVVATGPSLLKRDIDLMRQLFADLYAIGDYQVPLTTIVVNDAWKLAPWANVLYAGDHSWWTHNPEASGFKGEKLIARGLGSPALAAKKFGLNQLDVKFGSGLSTNPSYVHSGWNSGFAAFNLAINMGFREIFLLGFDYQIEDPDHIHFFGNHPKPLRNGLPIKQMILEMDIAAMQIAEDTTIEVTNLTRKTAIQGFQRMTVETLIADQILA